MSSSTSFCRGCGKPMFWIKTVAGKSMPCDPEPVTFWKKEKGSKKVVTEDGEVVSAELYGVKGMESGIGYISHFATCPKSNEFKR